jgi:hypothetical protein
MQSGNVSTVVENQLLKVPKSHPKKRFPRRLKEQAVVVTVPVNPLLPQRLLSHPVNPVQAASLEVTTAALKAQAAIANRVSVNTYPRLSQITFACKGSLEPLVRAISGTPCEWSGSDRGTGYPTKKSAFHNLHCYLSQLQPNQQPAELHAKEPRKNPFMFKQIILFIAMLCLAQAAPLQTSDGLIPQNCEEGACKVMVDRCKSVPAGIDLVKCQCGDWYLSQYEICLKSCGILPSVEEVRKTCTDLKPVIDGPRPAGGGNSTVVDGQPSDTKPIIEEPTVTSPVAQPTVNPALSSSFKLSIALSSFILFL